MEGFGKLINYKGKLGVVEWEDYCVRWKSKVDPNAIVLRVWVLEDFEKQEWSKSDYTLWDDKFFFVNGSYVSIRFVGMSDAGEIILSMRYCICEEPFYVFYFNPERNTLQSVEIKGLGNKEVFGSQTVYSFANHVEDLSGNDSKILSSSIYDRDVKTEDEKSEEEEEEEEEEQKKKKNMRKKKKKIEGGGDKKKNKKKNKNKNKNKNKKKQEKRELEDRAGRWN